MERVTSDVKVLHLGAAEFDTFLVGLCIDSAFDFEAVFCCGRRDQFTEPPHAAANTTTTHNRKIIP